MHIDLYRYSNTCSHMYMYIFNVNKLTHTYVYMKIYKY